MYCPHCRTENPQRARYCVECGTALVPQCASCGAQVSVQETLCSQCGAHLGGQSGADAAGLAERRQVTVLFCDLVGFTDLSMRLDPEDLHKLWQGYQDAATAVIKRFDGEIAQLLGDGLLVYFGYPRAHEDDAHRAVRSGLGILQAIRVLAPIAGSEPDTRLAARIGVHTGLVVVGEIGSGERRERLALGATPNLAARLQTLAAPGTLVISGATQRLVAGYFAMRDLGPTKLKGVGKDTLAYEVLHESAARNRLDVAQSMGLTPFTGRDAEVRLLQERWEEAKRGHGQVVLLCGEPGIGKSRLVRVLEEHVAKESSAWLTRCQASPYYQNTAFYPIIDMLERVVLQFGPQHGSDQRRDKLEGWLAQYGLPKTVTMPLFTALLSLEDEARYPPIIREPEQQKQKTMEALQGILLARAAVQPVLFVGEDLHWADPSTLDLLHSLMQKLASARVLALFTFRPDFSPPWRTESYVTQLTLGRLDRGHSAQIATWSAGNPLPPSVLNQVLSRTDGNPLFIEELSKTVLESGLLRESNGVLELVGPLPALAIPATLHDSLMARLDRLPTVKVVAQLGATLGRDFSYDLLRAVSPLKEPALQHALEQLVDAELLYQDGFVAAPRYIFKHALIQEAAYQAMVRSTRQDHHRRIAQVLAGGFSDTVEKQPELIAHHYSEAGMAEQAIPFWQRAGQRALARAANVEAISHFQRGLQSLDALPGSASVDARELELRMGLAPAYMAIKGWASPEVEQTCGRARDLAASLGNFPCNFGSLWGLWTNYFLRGRLREALETGKQVQQLAASAEPMMFKVMARHAVGYSHFYRGEFLQTREHAENGLAPYDQEGERAIVDNFQLSSSVALRMMLGCTLWMLGYPDRAPAIVDSAIALARELKHHPSEAFALGTSLLFHYYRLDVARAAQCAEQLLALARQEGYEIYSPVALMFRGWVLVERGRREEGIDETRRGLAEYQAMGNHLNQTIVIAMLARCQWQAGQTEDALATLQAEILEAQERTEGHFAPELHRLKGEILLERAQLAEGEASITRAMALAHEQSARMLELRAANCLSRLWERTRRRDEAFALLSEIYGRFTEGYDTAELRAARELLKRLGNPGAAQASINKTVLPT